eukprot:15600-Eustigmatos_ZCMA.PRE.1
MSLVILPVEPHYEASLPSGYTEKQLASVQESELQYANAMGGCSLNGGTCCRLLHPVREIG